MESATKYFLVKASEYRQKRNHTPPTSAAEHRKLGIKNSFDRVQKTLSGERGGDIYQATAEFRAKARAPLFQKQQPRVVRRPINPPRRVLPPIPPQPQQEDFDFDIQDLPPPQAAEHIIRQDSDDDNTSPFIQHRPQFFTPNTPPITPATPRVHVTQRRQSFDNDDNERSPTELTWNQDRQEETNVYDRLYNDRTRSTPPPRLRGRTRTRAVPPPPPRTPNTRRTRPKRGGVSNKTGAGYFTKRNAKGITNWEPRR